MKQKVLDFWFKELTPKDWYSKSPELDQEITDLFLSTYYSATKGELYSWRADIEGRLAEIIVLDQFSRNMFRNSPEAFAFDHVAVILSQEAAALPEVKTLTKQQESFVYMPLMHSESLIVHELALKVFTEAGLENSLEYEIKHKVIIEKFGRYPHRNEILGRNSTPEEIEFLKGPNSSF